METCLKREDIMPYGEMIRKRIREKHLRVSNCHDGRLFLISTVYPGYWLEHMFDSIMWARLHPEDADIPVSQLRLFLENQREDGKIPTCVLDNDLMNSVPGLAKAYTGQDVCPPGFTVRHKQLQECVSIARLALEIWQMNPADDLQWYYDCCCKWDAWQCENRMTRGKGLLETFCGFDTGHDNSARFDGMKFKGGMHQDPTVQPDGYPVGCAVAPMICPDINAVFYGGRIALAEMADILCKPEEAALWRRKAAEVKRLLLEICFDPEECFFFDVDKNDQKIRVKSISITTLFCEHVLDPELAEEIYNRYLANPKEFGTPYPFPGISISDPAWQHKLEGNDWGYYAQGNVILRTVRWMEHYGKTEDMLKIMEKWVSAWCRPGILRFGQELHPITGEPSACSEWYSTTMLYLLYAMRRLGLDGKES